MLFRSLTAELGEHVPYPNGDSVLEALAFWLVEQGEGIPVGTGVVGSSSSGVAGGGGSYNIGTNQQNKVGVNKGDGKVIITLKN